MAIQRRDPLREMRRLKDRMNRLFDETLSHASGPGEAETPPGGYRPPLDLLEQPDAFLLLADLPGVRPGDLSIEVDKGVLHLRGERRLDPSLPADSYLRVERPHGRFALQLTLPSSVDPKGIQAVSREGIVRITLPKRRRAEEDGRLKVDIR